MPEEEARDQLFQAIPGKNKILEWHECMYIGTHFSARVARLFSGKVCARGECED